jgi:transposase
MTAKKRAKKGRAPKLTRNDLRKLLMDKRATGKTFVQMAAQYKIGVNTIYNTILRYKDAKKKARKASAKQGVALSLKQAVTK